MAATANVRVMSYEVHFDLRDVSPLLPAHLRPLFTDRERDLAVLEQVSRDLAGGRSRHLALIGLRRVGNTLLMLHLE